MRTDASEGRVAVEKILGTSNVADVGTKHFDKPMFEWCCGALGLRTLTALGLAQPIVASSMPLGEEVAVRACLAAKDEESGFVMALLCS